MRVEFELRPRNETIGSLVERCANGSLPFSELCEKVSAMGYKTTSLYEIVVALERQRK